MDSLSGLAQRIEANINSVVLGKPEAVRRTLITFLCGGHLLIEDAPGLGKTLLAKAFSRTFALDFKRVQCTPDLLPTDITGVSIYDQKDGEFRYVPGPVFTNILLVDEINRATPRSQSALLECMAEAQVTADGKTRELGLPFMVIATQNPIEFSGTHPLPEAQLDRFMMRISLGYPDIEDEMSMMKSHVRGEPVDELQAVAHEEQIEQLKAAVREVYVDEKVLRYIGEITAATRDHTGIELGASPRGSMSLMKAAQAAAFLEGSDFVTPQNVKDMARPVLSHRLLLAHRAQLTGSGANSAIEDILDQVPVPVT